MGKPWSDAAVRQLTNWAVCPRCEWSPLEGGWCPRCEADLTSPEALALVEASRAAADALEARQLALDRLPSDRRTVDAAVAPAAVAVAAPPTVTPSAPVERPESQVSVQSVLAIAGAGLVAVAAIVFTFFNEALADLTTRSVVVAIISVVFLAAAWLLARARLQFSAEAVGALAMVFVVLDVWAVSTIGHPGVTDYAIAAVATVAVAAVMIGLASIRRLRTWLWSGLVGLTLTPLLFGLAVDTAWAVTLGWLGAGFVGLGVHELARLLAPRFASTLRFDHGTLTGLQFLTVVGTLVSLVSVPAGSDTERVLGISAVLAALALLSLLSTRRGLSALWSFLAGGFVTTAVAMLPFTAQFPTDEWLLALVPATAAGTLAIIVTLSRLRAAGENPVFSRVAVLVGSLAVATVTVAPAGAIAIGQQLSVHDGVVDADISIAAIVGGTAFALALLVIALARRSSAFASMALAVALFALVSLTTWVGLPDVARIVASLVVAVALVPLLLSTPLLRTAAPRFRLPLFAAAHLLVVQSAILTRADVPLGIYGGIAVTIAIAAIAVAMPRVAQPVYAAVAFAYGLLVFAFTLDNVTTLDPSTVIALTATLAVIVALAITAARAVPRAFWYAALIVTALPFLVSVGSLLVSIGGEVGIATGVALLLFATMTVIHRPGLTRELRAIAAALVVPTLAVAVISVVAEYARQFPEVLPSASPVTLPVIAGIVALTLPTTGLVGRLLERRGHSDDDVAAVRLLVEISALVTGSLAVLLTLLRAAAGFDTTFLVLVIIGLGAAATGQFVHRRYAWYVAFISFTGALWALLALNSITELEPYALPPALAAAAIGAIAVARGKRGLGFYAAGLSVAAGTPLLVLAYSGNGVGTVEWRSYGLLAGAMLLVLCGLLIGRVARLAALRAATLFVGLGAASAGVVQAVRYGTGVDASVYGRSELVMAPVLLFSLIAVAIAVPATVLLARSPRLAASRWLYLVPMVYLVLGPITAFRHGHLYSWTLISLMAVLLAIMLVTVVRSRTRQTSLPPVWATFALATFTAIAGWSEHTVFRVEAFTLALGLALLAAGIIGWRSPAHSGPSINRWPIGFAGSWWLLAPGIIVVLANSLMATLTDPETWRAILVIASALIAILLGNRLRLAAPFFLGIAALPLEILFVFAVQAGGKIEPTTWWITLASAGALLLVLAVSSERRASGEGGVAARLRDLR
jgi:hypothetical protein